MHSSDFSPPPLSSAPSPPSLSNPFHPGATFDSLTRNYSITGVCRPAAVNLYWSWIHPTVF